MTMTCTRCRAAPAPGTASEPRAATRLADPLDPRRRRRAADVVDDHARTTNAYTAETGWLMMAGEWPRRPQGDTTILDDGCWKIDATYKHSTLTYFFELHDPAQKSKRTGVLTTQLVRAAVNISTGEDPVDLETVDGAVPSGRSERSTVGGGGQSGD